MTNTGGDSWEATLPGADAGTLIRYRIESDVEVAPFAGDTINYFGLVVTPSDIVDNELPVLHLFFDPEELARITGPDLILTNTKIEAVVAYGDQVFDNATIRIRGGSYARTNFPKQSFKVELPKGYTINMGDQASHEFDEFALQAEYADWSFVAADISWDVFNEESETYAHSFHTRLEGNADFFGVYRFQELYDNVWRENNGIADDELYKAEGGWIFDVENGWDKKTPDDGDLTQISIMREVVISPDSPAKTQWLYENVDIPNAVNYMAISALMRHGDQRVHNFYMALDGETGKWQIIPWDLDQTWRDVFGGLTRGLDFTTIEPIQSDFLDAMWEVPDFQDMYWTRLQTLVDKYLQDDQLIDRRAELMASVGTTNSALEQSAWGRTDLAQDPDLVESWRTGIETRRALFAAETRLPGAPLDDPTIVINELHANPAGDDAEFLELYNASSKAVDLSDWVIDGVGLEIPKGTVILPDSYLVFTDDLRQFTAQTSLNSVYVGGQYGGGQKAAGETITLLDSAGNVVDEVTYTNVAPWTTGADGTGFTLSLIDPSLDNNVASSWQASTLVNGTPSYANTLNVEATTIKILAAGQSGNEIITLDVAGIQVATFDLSQFGGQAGDLQAGNFITLEWVGSSLEPISADDVRINFVNDTFDEALGIDYNVAIDRIEINDEIFETEAPTVFSTGTWLEEDGIVPGFRQSQVLHTNGYFQYATDDVVEPGPVIADGNIIQLFNNDDSVWLSASGTSALTTVANTASSEWELIAAGNTNQYRLRNVVNGRYLDGDFFRVDTNRNSAANGVIWEIEDAGDGEFTLFNLAWNRYLDSDGPNRSADLSFFLAADDLWTVSLVSAPEVSAALASDTGNVVATVTRAGDLRLIGDELDNRIDVVLNDASVFVKGLDGTTINGQAQLTIPLDNLRDLKIRLKGGDDYANLSSNRVAPIRNVLIAMGSGLYDRTNVSYLATTGNLAVNNSQNVSFSFLSVGDKLFVKGSRVSDVIEFGFGVSVEGTTKLNLLEGEDSVIIPYTVTTFASTFTANGGEDEDYFEDLGTHLVDPVYNGFAL